MNEAMELMKSRRLIFKSLIGNEDIQQLNSYIRSTLQNMRCSIRHLLSITDCRSVESQHCGEDEAVAEQVCIVRRLPKTCSLVSPCGTIVTLSSTMLLLSEINGRAGNLARSAQRGRRESWSLKFVQPLASWHGKAFIPHQLISPPNSGKLIRNHHRALA